MVERRAVGSRALRAAAPILERFAAARFDTPEMRP
jgi:hypothetical protein